MTSTRLRGAGLLVGALVVALLPELVGSDYSTLSKLEYVICLVMVATGLNIVTGYAGLLSLGPGAVFAIAAYATSVYANHFPNEATLPLLWLLGIGAAVVAGIVTAVPALRVGGFYLGMTTLFLALLVPQVAAHLSITGSQTGISLEGNLEFTQSPSGVELYEISALALGVLTFTSWRLLHSRTGAQFLTLKASPELASSIGVREYSTKLSAFIIGAVPAGIGGATFVYTQQYFGPGSASPNLSIYLLAGCVIGGFGTTLGPLVGGATIFGLAEFLGSLSEYQGIVFGAILLAVVSLAPSGLCGLKITNPFTARSRGRQLRRPVAPDSRLNTAVDRVALRPISSILGSVPPAELSITRVSRSFGGVRALESASLVARAGTVHALIGPNGSGKTTLLNVTSGFYKLDSGSVRLGDKTLSGLRAADIARAGVARTFQTPKLLLDETVAYNVTVGARIRASRPSLRSSRSPTSWRATAQSRISDGETVLEWLGIQQYAQAKASDVSHGTQRLIEVGRAVLNRPTFLLMDEPAAGLSPHEVEVLKKVIRGLAAAGVGVLLVEHQLPLVMTVADEVTVLHEGRVLAHGTVADILAHQEVTRVYLGNDASADATLGPTTESSGLR